MIYAIDDEIRQLLLSSPAVAGIVDDAVYFLRSPDESKFPRVIFWWVSYPAPTEHLRGVTSQSEGRLQVDLFTRGGSPKEIISLRQAVVNLLSGFSGSLGDVKVARFTMLDGGQTLTEPPADGSNQPIDHTILQFAAYLTQGRPANE